MGDWAYLLGTRLTASQVMHNKTNTGDLKQF
jgi:hypothetical protein